MSDKELNNLICYGPDYEVVDGCLRTDGYYNTMFLQNMLIKYPFVGAQSPDMNELVKEALSTSEVSPYVGFYFDTSNISEQILAV